MKNIHVLPTDKPSRLYEFGGQYFIQEKHQENFRSYNIYITDDSKIKKGDWCINPKNNKVMKVGHHGHHGYSSKKIILTTDVDLIKDGVQAIDDEILEWFVKNPSCEFVEIECSYSMSQSTYSGIEYKIIIPQEHNKYLSCCKNIEECHCGKHRKQEALEEFIRRESKSANESVGIIKGAKWQAENSNTKYTEKDMIDAFTEGFNARYRMEDGVESRHKFIEQIKKK